MTRLSGIISLNSSIPLVFAFQLSVFLENLSTKLSNAGDLDGILLTGNYHVPLSFISVLCEQSVYK